jgi:hypothetical protein
MRLEELTRAVLREPAGSPLDSRDVLRVWAVQANFES